MVCLTSIQHIQRQKLTPVKTKLDMIMKEAETVSLFVYLCDSVRTEFNGHLIPVKGETVSVWFHLYKMLYHR